MVEQRTSQGGVAIEDGLDDQAQGDDRDVADVADRAEQLHVAALHRAVKHTLQRLQIGDVDVVDIDAFLGQQGRQLTQRLVREPRSVLDLWHAWRWFGSVSTYVRHAPIFAAITRDPAQQVSPLSNASSHCAGVTQPRSCEDGR